MGTKYTSQATSGYNSSPPPDDGTQVAANLVTWAGVKTKLADVLKTFGEAINTALVAALDLSARAVSSNDTAVAGDHWKTLQVTGTTTITLSSASSMGAGYEVGVFNAGSGVVTVQPTGANTINNVSAAVTIPILGSAIFRTNQALTGYNIVSQNAQVITLTATTSVVTPAVDSGTTGSLSLKTNNGATQTIINNNSSADRPLNITGGQNGASNTKLEVGSGVGLAYITSGGSHQFYTGAGQTLEQVEILHTASANRVITLTGSNGGNPTISTTAGALALGNGQLQFPSSQNASSDANTLDDYEEGTWTPSVGGSATYTTQTGTYTKIGRRVFISMNLTINAIGTGSQTTISGLPFTAGNTGGGAITDFSTFSSNVVYITGLISSGGTSITLRSIAAAGASLATSALISTNTNVKFEGSYEV